MKPPDPRRDALFLDFDGTLVDIAPTPDAVIVPTGLTTLLGQIAETFGGAVAVVSGRPVAELDRFLDPLRLAAAGLHGLEWRMGGDIGRTDPPASLDALRTGIAASGLAARGLRVEDKGLSIALHYREAPHLGDEAGTFAANAAAAHPDLAVLAGKMVVEIKPRSASKASAVARFMAGAPFAGRRPVFVGDDVTDEDGMRAAIGAGGSGVKVGPGETVARTRLDDPAAVMSWLKKSLED